MTNKSNNNNNNDKSKKTKSAEQEQECGKMSSGQSCSKKNLGSQKCGDKDCHCCGDRNCSC